MRTDRLMHSNSTTRKICCGIQTDDEEDHNNRVSAVSHSSGGTTSHGEELSDKAAKIPYERQQKECTTEDSTDHDLTHLLPLAPTYTAAGIFGNKEIFDLVANETETQRRVADYEGEKYVDVFDEEIKTIIRNGYQKPSSNEEEQANADYRVNQQDFELIRFLNHGAMGFVFSSQAFANGQIGCTQV